MVVMMASSVLQDPSGLCEIVDWLRRADVVSEGTAVALKQGPPQALLKNFRHGVTLAKLAMVAVPSISHVEVCRQSSTRQVGQNAEIISVTTLGSFVTDSYSSDEKMSQAAFPQMHISTP